MKLQIGILKALIEFGAKVLFGGRFGDSQAAGDLAPARSGREERARGIALELSRLPFIASPWALAWALARLALRLRRHIAETYSAPSGSATRPRVMALDWIAHSH